MIYEITSDLSSFKTLEFNPGLNILLADKSPGASDLQSRNGAGKTSMVELIHFLLGADATPKGIFRSALGDWTFRLTVDIDEVRTHVSRSGGNHKFVSVDPCPVSEKALLNYELSNEEWKRILGQRWFGLRSSNDSGKYKLTFRSVFPYAARRQESGGFHKPTQHSAQQAQWNRKAAICYLIDLDWSIPARFHDLRERERSAKQLLKAIETGDIGSFFAGSGQLRTPLAIAEDQSRRLRKQLEEFKVLPKYRELEVEASKSTQEIGKLNLENVVDQELIQELTGALEAEIAPNIPDLAELYEEAGILLPELPRRRLRDVEVFHKTIVENRRTHLQSEIEAATARVQLRNRSKASIDERRRQVMQLLDGHGALDHYTALREELARAEAKCETLRQRLEAAESFERKKAHLAMERAGLVQAMHNDIHEREQLIRDAIIKFETLSSSLYERAGSLRVFGANSGPEFEANIEGERSKGITNMQIFCFDLTLLELGMERRQWPGFLIHDSHLFDGVDERQVAKALQLGAERAEESGFQYIVTMNSDILPSTGYEKGFRVDDYILDTRLTDATETGGLFGFRF